MQSLCVCGCKIKSYGCGLLHIATHVKCGRVYVVLWFVHDSPSAQRSLITVVCTGFGGLHFIHDFVDV